MTRSLAAERQSAPAAAAGAPAAQIAALDWAGIAAQLDSHGCATTGRLLTPQQCAALAASYASDALFRSRVVMARHGFGRGEYKYFAYPLPDVVAALRAALYPPLADIANRWNDALGIGVRFPGEHAAYLARCHKAGQTKPTPLLLAYGAGDYNCLHQDVYGEHVFPLQVAFCCRVRVKTSAGANSCSLSSGLACSRVQKWFRSCKVKASSSPCIIGRCKARAGPTASTCATA